MQCDCIMLVNFKKAEERLQAEVEVDTSLTVARVIGVTALQAFLADARRDDPRIGRIGTRWTTKTTLTTRTMTSTTAEVNKSAVAVAAVAVAAAAAAAREGEGSARRGSSGGRNT